MSMLSSGIALTVVYFRLLRLFSPSGGKQFKTRDELSGYDRGWREHRVGFLAAVAQYIREQLPV